MKRSQATSNSSDDRIHCIYYMAGCLITKQITAAELEEISALTKDEGTDEEYSQTFVIPNRYRLPNTFFWRNGY
jgi:hypothetical protein